MKSGIKLIVFFFFFTQEMEIIKQPKRIFGAYEFSEIDEDAIEIICVKQTR